MTVHYAVEGGYAHRVREVTVHEDGTLDIERNGHPSTAEIDAEQVTAIRDALDASGLFTEDQEYPPSPGAADLERHQLTYGGVTVVAYDTTVPPGLVEALALLERALAQG